MNQKLLQKWQATESWYNARNSRERIMVAALVVAAVVMLWLLLINDPIANRIGIADAKLKNLESQLQATAKEQSLLMQVKRVDPDVEIKGRIDNVTQRIVQIDTQLRQRMQGLIEPKQMAHILEQVLTQSTSMRLTRIESLAAKPLIDASNETSNETKLQQQSTDPHDLKQSNEPGYGVFQHGLKMEFEGNYLHTLSYLKKLQQLSWLLFWDGVTLEVLNYPNARVVITVHTLSLQEGWLGV